MTPELSDFIPGSLEDMDKHLKVADRQHVTSKQKGQVQINICKNNRDPFIDILHNVLFTQDLFNRFFQSLR